MTETNIRICKVCKQLKQRSENGRFSVKDKRYVDEHGKLWCGSICPPCNKERVKNKMKEMRANKDGKETVSNS